MPELPEVETVRSGVAPLLVGQTLQRIELRRMDLRPGTLDESRVRRAFAERQERGLNLPVTNPQTGSWATAWQGVTPGYEQRGFPAEERAGRLRLVASRDGREGSVTIHQDVDVFMTLLGVAQRVEHSLGTGRGAWVQVARGEADLNGHTVQEGDGAAIEGEHPPMATIGRARSMVMASDLGG